MGVDEMRGAAHLLRESSNSPLGAALADLLDAEAAAGPCEGDPEWNAAVVVARLVLNGARV